MMLTAENYFSKENQMKYFGVSQYKSFLKCPAGAVAEINGDFEREKTVSLLVGSYVDAHFEGAIDIFKAKNPQIFKRDGNLKSEYLKADEIINRVERDKLFMDFMSGAKQVIMTGEICGVPIKIKVDSLHEDKIVDLKIMKDFQPIYKSGEGKLSWVEAWGYDTQGAVYQEIVRQNTGITLPFYLAAATKEKVTDIDIVQISQELMDFELEKFKSNIMLFDGMKKGLIDVPKCGHCDYCKQTKVLDGITQIEELNEYE